MGLSGAPGGRTDLGGEINNTKAQVGISSHPLDKLHMHGDITYETKKNKTPLDFYNIFTGGPTPIFSGPTKNTFTNGNQSSERYGAKLEANYRLPQNYHLIGGAQYEHEDFGTFTPTEVAGGILISYPFLPMKPRVRGSSAGTQPMPFGEVITGMP